MNELSDGQLIELQATTLFVCDANRRLQFIREPGDAEWERDPAPRFWMGRTKQGNIWRFHHDLPTDLVQQIDHICRTEPVAENLAHPPTNAAAIRALLHTHMPITSEERGPAYRMPDTIAFPTEAMLISETNAHVLEANFPWKRSLRSNFRTAPIVATIVHANAVAICFCARLTDQAAEAGVETVATERGHGYASAAVAGWISVIRQRRLRPLYSTSWANLASQSVARKLGLICYGDDWSIG